MFRKVQFSLRVRVSTDNTLIADPRSRGCSIWVKYQVLALRAQCWGVTRLRPRVGPRVQSDAGAVGLGRQRTKHSQCRSCRRRHGERWGGVGIRMSILRVGIGLGPVDVPCMRMPVIAALENTAAARVSGVALCVRNDALAPRINCSSSRGSHTLKKAVRRVWCPCIEFSPRDEVMRQARHPDVASSSSGLGSLSNGPFVIRCVELCDGDALPSPQASEWIWIFPIF